jgi:hypothetical protein
LAQWGVARNTGWLGPPGPGVYGVMGLVEANAGDVCRLEPHPGAWGSQPAGQHGRWVPSGAGPRIKRPPPAPFIESRTPVASGLPVEPITDEQRGAVGSDR